MNGLTGCHGNCTAETQSGRQTFPTQPGVTTLVLPWRLGKQHAFISERWRNLSLTLGMCWAEQKNEIETVESCRTCQSSVVKMHESTVKYPWLFATYHLWECVVNLTICVSTGRNNNENRGPLSRSVVGVRLGRLIWAHSGRAQWSSSLCSTARLRSALPQRQPALLQPRGQIFPAARLRAPFASL